MTSTQSLSERVEHVDDTTERQTTRTMGSRTWSPAQLVAGVAGLILIVMGGVALARLLPTDGLTSETTIALGIQHTPLMAVIAIAVGLLYLAQAGAPFEVQPGMISLGVTNLAFGLVVVIEPGAFDGSLGLGETGGWFYAVLGLISVITAIVSPTIISRRQT